MGIIVRLLPTAGVFIVVTTVNARWRVKWWRWTKKILGKNSVDRVPIWLMCFKSASNPSKTYNTVCSSTLCNYVDFATLLPSPTARILLRNSTKIMTPTTHISRSAGIIPRSICFMLACEVSPHRSSELLVYLASARALTIPSLSILLLVLFNKQVLLLWSVIVIAHSRLSGVIVF